MATEVTQAFSSMCPRFDVVAGLTIGGAMTVTGITADDKVIYFISRDASGQSTDRLSTITVGAGSITSSANLSGLNCEIFWLDASA